MQLPVMIPAQGYQVVQAGFSAICPVLYVVRVHIPRFTTAGEATGFVSQAQGAADIAGDCTGFAADVEHPALLVFQHGNQAGIAGEAPGGIGGYPVLALHLAMFMGRAGFAVVLPQGIDVYVQYELTAFTAL
jgi:hypothetical protein